MRRTIGLHSDHKNIAIQGAHTGKGVIRSRALSSYRVVSIAGLSMLLMLSANYNMPVIAPLVPTN